MRSGNGPTVGNRQSTQSTNNGPKTLKVNKGLLRFFSVINIIVYSVCVGLEAYQPYVGQGFWGSSVYLVSGLLGFGTSYRPTYTRLTWVLAFSCMSILFGFIVSGLSWAGYTDCDHYYRDYDFEGNNENSNFSFDYDEDDCDRPISQLALMIVNIFAIVISFFVTITVSSPLCCPDKFTTQNLHTVNSTVRVATIDSLTNTTDRTGNRTTTSPTGIHNFPSHRPEMEILSRLAFFGTCRQEEEERPPRYSIAVAESSVVNEIIT